MAILAAWMERYELYFVIAALCFTVVVLIPWLSWQVISANRLRNQRKKTELLHLRSQVSPHFFFNTLNNLYGLITNDPKKAQSLVLDLSEMMRYSIYKAQQPSVPLEDEVEYINRYIGLHAMRYHKKVDVRFDVDIPNGLRIMPLLFIILVENAFKHGVENLRDQAFVHLALTAPQDEIIFEIRNNFDESAVSEQRGIGLENLQRTLNLAYEGKHRLELDRRPGEYRAELRLKNV
jgi:two-component system, LytTR family, sensor histidine kinase AlgZ